MTKVEEKFVDVPDLPGMQEFAEKVCEANNRQTKCVLQLDEKVMLMATAVQEMLDLFRLHDAQIDKQKDVNKQHADCIERFGQIIETINECNTEADRDVARVRERADDSHRRHEIAFKEIGVCMETILVVQSQIKTLFERVGRLIAWQTRSDEEHDNAKERDDDAHERIDVIDDLVARAMKMMQNKNQRLDMVIERLEAEDKRVDLLVAQVARLEKLNQDTDEFNPALLDAEDKAFKALEKHGF